MPPNPSTSRSFCPTPRRCAPLNSMCSPKWGRPFWTGPSPAKPRAQAAPAGEGAQSNAWVSLLSFHELQAAANGPERTHLDRDAVAVGDHLVSERRDPPAGQDDADQIQRIGCADEHEFARRRRTAHRAERVHGLGQGVLLPDEAAHEPPTADLPTGLQAPEDVQ